MPKDVDPRFAAELRRLRVERRLSLRGLAELAHRSKSHLHELETGRKRAAPAVARQLDDVLRAGGRLVALAAPAPRPLGDDEVDAWELSRRVEASDVSTETLDRIERAVDDMASAYATTAPGELLPLVRRHLGYVTRLLGARATLAQRRRLIVAGGWLALLRATVHIDLRHRAAADAHLATAQRLAAQAEHAEISAWCLETRAWDALTAGDYRRAAQLSQHAQVVAPRGGSAHIQATAQEGRAWARMGDRRRTRGVLDRLHQLVGPLSTPDRPEHHYRYDPGKAAAYTATTLAWAGDPAAAGVAREVLADLEAAGGRPRRVASARLDLGLALVAAGEVDEAIAVGETAIVSGRIAPSNWWRATELVLAVERTGIPQAAELRDAYAAYEPEPGRGR